ncbi:MAG: MGMT family protein [Myxococcota bacterium]
MKVSYAAIYKAVKRIPKGRVATYGQIAELAGIGPRARQVGYALSALEDARVPWHRVINAKGEISLSGSEQRQRLEAEGVQFDAQGRVDLAKYRYRPRKPR